jgi:hypothetical protein
MTQASFYRQEQSNGNTGIYFEIPEKELAKELNKRKQEEYSKLRQCDKLINEN